MIDIHSSIIGHLHLVLRWLVDSVFVMNLLWGYELQRGVLFLFSVMLYHKAGNFLPFLLTKNPSSLRGFRDKSNGQVPTEEASAHGTCCGKCLHGREADLPNVQLSVNILVSLLKKN